MALVDDVVALLKLDDGKWRDGDWIVSRGWSRWKIEVSNHGDLWLGDKQIVLTWEDSKRLSEAYKSLKARWYDRRIKSLSSRIRRIAAKVGINPDGTTTYVLKPRFRWFRALGALGALAAAVVYAEQIKWVVMTALSLVR